jgi:hypothetical protein
MMQRNISRLRLAVAAVLAGLIIVSVTALSGVAAPGKGKPPGKGNAAKKAAGPAQKQYGPGGKQYGHHKVTICHKGKTISVAPPAVKAHLKHGDRLGRC